MRTGRHQSMPSSSQYQKSPILEAEGVMNLNVQQRDTNINADVTSIPRTDLQLAI